MTRATGSQHFHLTERPSFRHGFYETRCNETMHCSRDQRPCEILHCQAICKYKPYCQSGDGHIRSPTHSQPSRMQSERPMERHSSYRCRYPLDRPAIKTWGNPAAIINSSLGAACQDGGSISHMTIGDDANR